MTKLADFRAKYPAYDDMDDETLSNALYEKHYSDMDRRDFDARLGTKPYQNVAEGVATAVAALPGMWQGQAQGAAQLAGEAGNEATREFYRKRFEQGDFTAPRGGDDAFALSVMDFAKTKGLPGSYASADMMLADPARREEFQRYLGMTGAENTIRSQVTQAEIRDKTPQVDVRPGSLTNFATDVVTGVGQTLPVIATAALAGPAGLPVGMGLSGAQVAGGTYGESRQDQFGDFSGFLEGAGKEGLTPETARQYAGLYGAAEGLTELLPLKVFLKEGGKLASRVAKGMVAEGIQEGVTEALQAAIDKGYVEPDMTFAEAWPRVLYASAVGAVSGGVINAAMGGANKMLGRTGDADPLAPGNEIVDQDDTPIEEVTALPAPEALLALPPPPEPAVVDPRYRSAPTIEEPTAPSQEQIDFQAQEALAKTKQTETMELLQTARETIAPLGSFTADDIPGEAVQRVNTWRVQTGRQVDAPITIEDMARAKVPQSVIDAAIATRRPRTSGQLLNPRDITALAAEKNIVSDDANFKELAYKATGTRNVGRMSQAQLRALQSTLEAMPAHESLVTIPVADISPFSESQYSKAIDAVRAQGRYTVQAIKDATGLNNNKDVRALRDAMLRRGQLVERGKNDFRLYDVIGKERQTVPDDLPVGAFTEHVVKKIPVNRVRIKQDGKSIGTFDSGTEARNKVSALRQAETEKGTSSAITMEPAEETAFGIMENRYDENGNFLGQVVVDTSRNEADARKRADQRNAPADTGARYTVEHVEPGSQAPQPAPRKKAKAAPPAALAGRVQEVMQKINDIAQQRGLPLLGTKVTVRSDLRAPDGTPVEGTYHKNLIELTAANLSPDMSDAEVVDALAQIMDHELIHALRGAGVLAPDSDGWQTLVNYTRKTKRPGTNETYLEWANRNYAKIPGYETADSRQEEAIAEAFRSWASDKRNVAGKTATVFRQLVEWFQRVLRIMPVEIFENIESGQMVRDAVTPPGSGNPRAQATKAMTKATAAVKEAQATGDEKGVQANSREFLRAREQAREDRNGRSGPKTVIGTNASRAYDTAAPVPELAQKFVQKYQAVSGNSTPGLATYLPTPVDYLKKVADAQSVAAHDPEGNAVAKAYRALIGETRTMFEALGPLSVERWTGDGAPYASQAEMLADIDNGKLRMRLSEDMFAESPDNAEHPLHTASGYATTDSAVLTNNDILRVVHDVYGRGPLGLRGTPRDDYNAYHEHARMLSSDARKALATETLAQSAWHNYGPHLRRKDGSVPTERSIDYLPPNQKEFAEQKAFLMPDDALLADPGIALAEEAAAVPGQDDTPLRYSLRGEQLPGGKYYGDPDRSPGAMLSPAEAAPPSFTAERDGNAFFAGDMANEQIRMAAYGIDGATQVYLRPEEFLALTDPKDSSEQGVYNEAVNEGYKFNTVPSVVLDGYAGIVRATHHDGAYMAKALVGKARHMPVVVYPKRKESMGLVTALEGPRKQKIAWPKDGRQENFLDLRGPRYSVGSEKFKSWFGDSKVVDRNGAPMVVYHGSGEDFSVFNTDGGKGKTFGTGAFFSSSVATAQTYSTAPSPNVMPVFLSLQNPFVIEWEGRNWARGNGDAVTNPGTMDEDSLSSYTNAYPDEEVSTDDMVRMVRNMQRPSDIEALVELGINPESVNPFRQYDGVILRGVIDRGPSGKYHTAEANEPTDIFVAFQPGQIKSAIANNGSWDAADPDVRYSLNAQFGARVPSTGPDTSNIVEQRVDNWLSQKLHNIGRSKKAIVPGKLLSTMFGESVFDARVKYEDKMLSVKEMVETIKKMDGKVTDATDTYMVEQLASGRTVQQIEGKERDLYDPLFAALQDEARGADPISTKDFEDFLYARHAPERNTYLRARGSKAPNPSGMSDAEAGAILDRVALQGKLPRMEQLASMADAIAADTTRVRVEAGLISQKAADGSPYEHYVPLRGKNEEDLDAEDVYDPQTRPRSGKGYTVGGREDRATTGRHRKAGDILGHLLMQNTESIIRAEKNNVAMSFMRLISDNPDTGYGTILESAPTRQVVGANGMIREAGDPQYRQQPDIFTAKYKGKEIVARVGDPRVARAMKSDYVTQTGAIVNTFGMVNRYLATINTSFNPEFLISNLARDMQTAGILSAQYNVEGLGKKVLTGAPKAMQGINEVLRHGTASTPMAEAFKEMQAAGGTTEFLGIRDLETHVRRLKRDAATSGLNPTMRQARDHIGAIGRFVNDYNKVAENAFRLSAYVAAREAGVSVEKSAFLAKNLTINFNKGGENKAVMNAMYLFYNASVGGTFTLLRGLKSKRVQKIVGGIVVAGAVQDTLNRVLSGDEDDNGVKDYDDIPEYILENNWVFMSPGSKGYMAIPMPYGFNVFHNLGRNLSNSLSGSPVHTPGKSASSMLMTAFSAFNPMGGSNSVFNFIAPTIADPFVDLMTNKDFADNDIVPDNPTFGLETPDSQKYWSNIGAIPKWTAEHLNRLSGGNEVRSGAIDISPEVMQYWFDYATGATGKFVTRNAQLGQKLVTGDFGNVEVGDIPFARRLVGTVNNRGNIERYYENATEIKTIKAELELAKEGGDRAFARKILASKPAQVKLIDIFDKGEKMLADTRKKIREVKAYEKLDPVRKREIVDALSAKQDEIMAKLNNLYFTRVNGE